jgi:hypothetical protein
VTITPDDLAAQAGVNPWSLNKQLAVGDPAQVETLAASFYKAGGDMATSNADTAKAKTYVSEGYTVNGTTPIKFDQEASGTGNSAENLVKIGKLLDTIAGDLDTAAKKSAGEITALNTTIDGINGEYTTFMQGIGHHLPPEDQQSTRDGYIRQAVEAVQARAKTINTLLTTYEESVYGATKSLSDLGYDAPDALDDLSGSADAYIAQLQKQAKQDADKIKNNHTLDGGWAKDVHSVDKNPYLDDPYYASAFYGELGPQLTEMLPTMLQASGSSTASADLKALSHLFGTAVSNSDDDPGMDAVKQSFLSTPKVSPQSWDRAAMVSSGNFPPDWLAQAARANALDPFAKDGAEGFNGMGFDGGPSGSFPYDVGVPTNVVAAWTQALGHNPQASREALATMGSSSSDVTLPPDPSGAYQTNIHKLIEYGKQVGYPGDVDRAYGSAFEAASGADDETDGAHSAAASTFAKALFNDLGKDSGEVSPVTAENFAKIGGSYTQEMAAGAGSEGDSTLDQIPENSRFPGQHPSFAIPQELTEGYMKSFVGDEHATHTFDDLAGTQLHNAQLAAAQADKGLPAADADTLNHVSNAYGTVAGTENSVTREVVGERDESTEHDKELIRGILSAGVDLIPGEKVAEKIPGTVWDVAKHMTNMGLERVYGETADPRFNALNDTSNTLAITGSYQQAAVLQEAGYPGTEHIPAELIDPKTHHMVSAGAMLNDPKLRAAFGDYMEHAGRDRNGDHTSVYDMTQNSAGNYQLGFDVANKPPAK